MIYCEFDDELGDLCGNEAQHFYNSTDPPGFYKARCEMHKFRIPGPTYNRISENEYLVAQIMES